MSLYDTKVKLFRDPVHGDIELPRELLQLIDTVSFQRLRGVAQLGTANFVYPGACHTRFDHALGVAWTTNGLLDQLVQRSWIPLEDELRLAILAAALLHDCTHLPFGHIIEDERRIFERHDSKERIQAMLEYPDFKNPLSSLGISQLVEDILLESDRVPAFSWQVLSGPIGGDLLDYLKRDAYFSGVGYEYDSRILRSFKVNGQGQLYVEAHRDGLLRNDVLSELVNLLRLRYFLSERVYFHPGKIVSGAMISKAVELALEYGLNLEQLSQATDASLLLYLKNEVAPQDKVVGKLLEGIFSHNFYKKAYVLHSGVDELQRQELVDQYHYSMESRKEIEELIIRKSRLRQGDIIVYCPALGMQMKEVEVAVDVGQENLVSLRSLSLPELKVIEDLHKSLWRFYVFIHPEKVNALDKVSQTCEKFFGLQNGLESLQGPQRFLFA